jgi:hypothetical protein
MRGDDESELGPHTAELALLLGATPRNRGLGGRHYFLSCGSEDSALEVCFLTERSSLGRAHPRFASNSQREPGALVPAILAAEINLCVGVTAGVAVAIAGQMLGRFGVRHGSRVAGSEE